tara:strand:- start:1515 stop:2144 length:630 start_codon:yes stop_codon:yes gene_type:complete
MGAVVALGAIGLAGGVFSGIMGAQQASADRAAQIAQIRYQNLVRGIQTDAKNIQLLSKWATQFKQAKLQAVAAGARSGQKKFYLREALSNQFNQVGNQTQSLNAAVISKAGGKGLNMSSGTVKAIMRQNAAKSAESNSAIIQNFKKEMVNIDRELVGSISASQFLQPGLESFYAASDAVPDHSGSILAGSIVSGTLGGVSQGIGVKYGN